MSSGPVGAPPVDVVAAAAPQPRAGSPLLPFAGRSPNSNAHDGWRSPNVLPIPPRSGDAHSPHARVSASAGRSAESVSLPMPPATQRPPGNPRSPLFASPSPPQRPPAQQQQQQQQQPSYGSVHGLVAPRERLLAMPRSARARLPSQRTPHGPVSASAHAAPRELTAAAAPQRPTKATPKTVSSSVGAPLDAKPRPTAATMPDFLDEPSRTQSRARALAALESACDTFLHHLPDVWAKPALRAVALQTLTERLPPRIVGSSVLFDALSDLCGEMSPRVELRTPPPPPPPASPPAADGGGGEPLAISGAQSVDLWQLLAVAPAVLRYRLHNQKELKVYDVLLQYTQAAQQQQTAYEEQRLAREKLREQQRQEDADQQQQQQSRAHPHPPPLEPPPELIVPTRAQVSMELLRPHSGDIQFGAHLTLATPRRMAAGAPLLLPSTDRTAARAPEPSVAGPSNAAFLSVAAQEGGGGGGGSNSSSFRSALTARSCSPSGSSESLAVVAAPLQWCVAAASVAFELMPSIYLKAQYDLRRAQERQSARQRHSSSGSSRRRRVSPFFSRELAVALAVGHPACCLFASTLAPEFLVGLPSFLAQPMQSISAAVRATLHRLWLVLTAELVHANTTRGEEAADRTGTPLSDAVGATSPTSGGAGVPDNSICAPPLDLALTYLREHLLCFAATAGLVGKLFFSSNSIGALRPCIDLTSAFTHAEQIFSLPGSDNAALASLCGGSSPRASDDKPPRSPLADSATSSAQSFRMPAVHRGHVDLAQFSAGARLLEVFYRHHHSQGSAAGDSGASVRTTAAVTGRCYLPPLSVAEYLSAPKPLLVEPSLGNVVVVAAAEFWEVVPATLVSDLLRAMLLLSRAAVEYLRDSRGGVPRHDNGAADPRAGEDELAGTGSFTLERQQQQQQRVSQYLAALSGPFSARTRAHLRCFYGARVRFHSALDHRNAQTAQERLNEELLDVARQRRDRARSGSPSSSGAAPNQRHDDGDDNDNDDDGDGDADAARELGTQSLPDAMATVLSTLAAELRSADSAASTGAHGPAAAAAGALPPVHRGLPPQAASSEKHSLVVLLLPETAVRDASPPPPPALQR